MTTDLTIGKTYKVNSSRKGVFNGIVTQWIVDAQKVLEGRK